MATVQALDPTAIWTHQSHHLQVFKVNECSPTLGNNRQTSEEVMTWNSCVHQLDLWGETGSWILAVQCSPWWLSWTDTKLGALKAPLISFLFKHKFNLTLIRRETLHNWISQWYSFFFLQVQLNFHFTAEPSLLSCPAAPSELLLELCSGYSIRCAAVLAKPGAAVTPLWAELNPTKVNFAAPFPFPFSSRSVTQCL